MQMIAEFCAELSTVVDGVRAGDMNNRLSRTWLSGNTAYLVATWVHAGRSDSVTTLNEL